MVSQWRSLGLRIKSISQLRPKTLTRFSLFALLLRFRSGRPRKCHRKGVGHGTAVRFWPPWRLINTINRDATHLVAPFE